MVARNRLTISGRLGNVEDWSTTMNFATAEGTVLAGSETLTEWCEAIALGLEGALGGALLTMLSTVGDVRTITAYQYGESGPAIAVGEALVTDLSGSGTLKCPFQTSIVIGGRASQIGARYRSRNYWPAIGGTVSTVGKFSTITGATGVAQRWAETMEFIGGALGGGISLLPHIYSPTYDLLTPVSSYVVDDVPDIQRRRVDALVGTQEQVPFPPA